MHAFDSALPGLGLRAEPGEAGGTSEASLAEAESRFGPDDGIRSTKRL